MVCSLSKLIIHDLATNTIDEYTFTSGIQINEILYHNNILYCVGTDTVNSIGYMTEFSDISDTISQYPDVNTSSNSLTTLASTQYSLTDPSIAFGSVVNKAIFSYVTKTTETLNPTQTNQCSIASSISIDSGTTSTMNNASFDSYCTGYTLGSNVISETPDLTWASYNSTDQTLSLDTSNIFYNSTYETTVLYNVSANSIEHQKYFDISVTYVGTTAAN